MRTRYIVCYDISDPKRLRKIFRKMKGFGTHLQFSVFACDLIPQRRIEMEADLSEIINHAEDRIVIANVGPADGRGSISIDCIGRQEAVPERKIVVW